MLKPDWQMSNSATSHSNITEEDNDDDDILLPTIIDNRAHVNPERLYCAFVEPKHASIEEGLRKVTYGQFANAVNRCAWWLEKELGKSQNFETLAYVGPSDIRYSIVTLAAVKTGHKVEPFTDRLGTVADCSRLC